MKKQHKNKSEFPLIIFCVFLVALFMFAGYMICKNNYTNKIVIDKDKIVNQTNYGDCHKVIANITFIGILRDVSENYKFEPNKSYSLVGNFSSSYYGEEADISLTEVYEIEYKKVCSQSQETCWEEYENVTDMRIKYTEEQLEKLCLIYIKKANLGDYSHANIQNDYPSRDYYCRAYNYGGGDTALDVLKISQTKCNITYVK